MLTAANKKTHKIRTGTPGVMEMLARSAAVLRKDLTCEFRTRYAINAIVLFAVTTLAAVSFSVGGVEVSRSVQAALLWIIIYFSALSGLSRTFVREEESRTADALRLAAPPGAVFGGKLLFNLLLLFTLEVVIVPLFLGMMGVVVKGWLLFLVVIGVGSMGLVVSATIVAALVSRANAKSALFAVLAFPILLPVLIAGIRGIETAFTSSVFVSGMQDVKLLVSYTGIMFVVSLLIFRFAWED